MNQLDDLKRQLDELFKEFKELSKDKATGDLLYSEYKKEENLKPLLQQNILEAADAKSEIKLLTGKKQELEKDLQEKHAKMLKEQLEVRELKKRVVVAKASLQKNERLGEEKPGRPSDVNEIEARKKQIRQELDSGLLQYQSEMAHLDDMKASFKRENAELDSMVKELTRKIRINDLKIKDLLRMQRTRQTILNAVPGGKKPGVKAHLEEIVRQQDFEIEKKLRKLFGDEQLVYGSNYGKNSREALFYETSNSPGARTAGKLKYMRGSASQSPINPKSAFKDSKAELKAGREDAPQTSADPRNQGDRQAGQFYDRQPPKPAPASKLPSLEDRDSQPLKQKNEQQVAAKVDEQAAPKKPENPKPLPSKHEVKEETPYLNNPAGTNQSFGKPPVAEKPHEKKPVTEARPEQAAGNKERVLGVDGRTATNKEPSNPPPALSKVSNPPENKPKPVEPQATLHSTDPKKQKTDIEKLDRELGLSVNQIDNQDSTSKKFSLGGESSIPKEPDITTKTITAVKQSDSAVKQSSSGPKQSDSAVQKDPSLEKVQKNFTKHSDMTKQDFVELPGSKAHDLSVSKTYPKVSNQDSPVPKTSNTLKPPLNLQQNLLNSSQENENEEEDWNVLES